MLELRFWIFMVMFVVMVGFKIWILQTLDRKVSCYVCGQKWPNWKMGIFKIRGKKYKVCPNCLEAVRYGLQKLEEQFCSSGR